MSVSPTSPIGNTFNVRLKNPSLYFSVHWKNARNVDQCASWCMNARTKGDPCPLSTKPSNKEKRTSFSKPFQTTSFILSHMSLMLGTAYELWTLENVEEETKFKFMLYARGATLSKLFPDTRTDEANNTDDTYIFWPLFSPKIDEELHTPPWPLLHLCVISNTPPSNFLVITFRWPVHPISGQFPSSNSTIFSTSTTTLSAFNNSRYLFRCSPGTASPLIAGFILHFISSMVSSKVFKPKTGRIGDDSLHVSPSVFTSAGPVGSPSVWACAPTASGALSISRSMSRAVNVALSSSGQNTVKITET